MSASKWSETSNVTVVGAQDILSELRVVDVNGHVDWKRVNVSKISEFPLDLGDGSL